MYKKLHLKDNYQEDICEVFEECFAFIGTDDDNNRIGKVEKSQYLHPLCTRKVSFSDNSDRLSHEV